MTGMALRLRKDVKKSSYYVWFLGAKESKGLRGIEFIVPVIAYLEERERDVEPFKVTLQVSHKGLKIIQNIVAPSAASGATTACNNNGGSNSSSNNSKKKPSAETIKHFIPHNTITCVYQQEDVIGCILLLFNPVTKCPLHVHAYRCDSLETAAMLKSQLQVLIDRPENQKKFAEIESRLMLAMPLPPSVTPMTSNGANNKTGRKLLESSSSSLGGSGTDSSAGSDEIMQQHRNGGGGGVGGGAGTAVCPTGGVVTAGAMAHQISSSIPWHENPHCVSQLYDSVAAELREKLRKRSGVPILLPPRDYDTVHRQKGNLRDIDDRRCLNMHIVGAAIVPPVTTPPSSSKTGGGAGGGVESSGASSGIGSDHPPSPESPDCSAITPYGPHNHRRHASRTALDPQSSSGDEEWNEPARSDGGQRYGGKHGSGANDMMYGQSSLEQQQQQRHHVSLPRRPPTKDVLPHHKQRNEFNMSMSKSNENIGWDCTDGRPSLVTSSNMHRHQQLAGSQPLHHRRHDIDSDIMMDRKNQQYGPAPHPATTNQHSSMLPSSHASSLKRLQQQQRHLTPTDTNTAAATAAPIKPTTYFEDDGFDESYRYPYTRPTIPNNTGNVVNRSLSGGFSGVDDALPIPKNRAKYSPCSSSSSSSSSAAAYRPSSPRGRFQDAKEKFMQMEKSTAVGAAPQQPLKRHESLCAMGSSGGGGAPAYSSSAPPSNNQQSAVTRLRNSMINLLHYHQNGGARTAATTAANENSGRTCGVVPEDDDVVTPRRAAHNDSNAWAADKKLKRRSATGSYYFMGGPIVEQPPQQQQQQQSHHPAPSTRPGVRHSYAEPLHQRYAPLLGSSNGGSRGGNGPMAGYHSTKHGGHSSNYVQRTNSMMIQQPHFHHNATPKMGIASIHPY